MAASDYLYQFCDFYISFAIIPSLQKQKIKTTHNFLMLEKYYHKELFFLNAVGFLDLPLTRKV